LASPVVIKTSNRPQAGHKRKRVEANSTRKAMILQERIHIPPFALSSYVWQMKRGEIATHTFISATCTSVKCGQRVKLIIAYNSRI
jgi:hypothetical protein